jgi:hypothetical protein
MPDLDPASAFFVAADEEGGPRIKSGVTNARTSIIQEREESSWLCCRHRGERREPSTGCSEVQLVHQRHCSWVPALAEPTSSIERIGVANTKKPGALG